MLDDVNQGLGPLSPLSPTLDVAAETLSYAAYLNTPRGVLDPDEQHLFDQDLAKAKAAMERAWLESTPTKEKP